MVLAAISTSFLGVAAQEQIQTAGGGDIPKAYRAPTAVKGLTIDVSDPLAFNVFMNGESKGPLQAAQTPLGKLSG